MAEIKMNNVSERFLRDVGANFVTELDRIFNFETVRALRDNENAEETLKSDAEWLKKILPDCIDKTAEKYLSLIKL